MSVANLRCDLEPQLCPTECGEHSVKPLHNVHCVYYG